MSKNKKLAWPGVSRRSVTPRDLSNTGSPAGFPKTRAKKRGGMWRIKSTMLSLCLCECGPHSPIGTVLQGKLSGVARRGWYRSVWEKAPCLIDLYVMAIEIKIEYSYYSTKRITPVYIVEEELMTLEYSKFVERIVNEVRHLRRMNSLPLTVKED